MELAPAGRKRGHIMQLSRSEYELFGHQCFMAQIDLGGLPFDKVAQTIELLASEVAPVVWRETSTG